MPQDTLTGRIAGNLLLAAVTRLGVPLMIPAVIYVVAQVVSADTRLQLIEQDLKRVRDLEIRVARDAEITAQLRSDLAAMRASQDATLRAVERIERRLDAAPR